MLCLLLSNLHLYSIKHQSNEDIHVEHVSEQTCTLLIHNAMEATKIIINADSAVTNSTGSIVKEVESSKQKTKDYVRQMETVCCHNLRRKIWWFFCSFY